MFNKKNDPLVEASRKAIETGNQIRNIEKEVMEELGGTHLRGMTNENRAKFSEEVDKRVKNINESKKKANIVSEAAPAPNSPEDRGAADAHYGRKHSPHYYKDVIENGKVVRRDKIDKSKMEPHEIEAYTRGYKNASDFGDGKKLIDTQSNKPNNSKDLYREDVMAEMADQPNVKKVSHYHFTMTKGDKEHEARLAKLKADHGATHTFRLRGRNPDRKSLQGYSDYQRQSYVRKDDATAFAVYSYPKIRNPNYHSSYVRNSEGKMVKDPNLPTGYENPETAAKNNLDAKAAKIKPYSYGKGGASVKMELQTIKEEIENILSEGVPTRKILANREQINEALRHIETYTDGDNKAVVYRDAGWNEYRVKYHQNGKYLPDADSHHDDADDAHDTAKFQLKHMKNNGKLDEAKMTRKEKDAAVRRFMSHDPDAGEKILAIGKKDRAENKAFASAKKELKPLQKENRESNYRSKSQKMIDKMDQHSHLPYKMEREYAIKSILHNYKNNLISKNIADQQLKAHGHKGLDESRVPKVFGPGKQGEENFKRQNEKIRIALKNKAKSEGKKEYVHLGKKHSIDEIVDEIKASGIDIDKVLAEGPATGVPIINRAPHQTPVPASEGRPSITKNGPPRTAKNQKNNGPVATQYNTGLVAQRYSQMHDREKPAPNNIPRSTAQSQSAADRPPTTALSQSAADRQPSVVSQSAPSTQVNTNSTPVSQTPNSNTNKTAPTAAPKKDPYDTPENRKLKAAHPADRSIMGDYHG